MNVILQVGDDVIMSSQIVSLTRMKIGESGKIYDFKEGKKLCKKLDSLGIRKGKNIKKISDIFLKGPITIQIENSSTIAIGRGMAEKIMVKVDS